MIQPPLQATQQAVRQALTKGKPRGFANGAESAVQAHQDHLDVQARDTAKPYVDARPYWEMCEQWNEPERAAAALNLAHATGVIRVTTAADLISPDSVPPRACYQPRSAAAAGALAKVNVTAPSPPSSSTSTTTLAQRIRGAIDAVPGAADIPNELLPVILNATADEGSNEQQP